MNVISLTYYENGMRTLTVRCAACGFASAVVWPYGTETINTELACGHRCRLTVPTWVRNPRRTRTNPTHLAADRDNAAIDNPVPNWTE